MENKNGTTEYKGMQIENIIDFDTFWTICLMNNKDCRYGEAKNLYKEFNRLKIESKLGINLF